MSDIYKYRLIKAGWGIIIDIDCSIHSLSDYNGTDLYNIGDSIRLDVSVKGFQESEIQWLIKGLQLVSEELISKLSNTPTVIKIIYFEPSITDYQEEGLACAIAGWAAQKYELSYIHPPVYFDKEKNRYAFNF